MEEIKKLGCSIQNRITEPLKRGDIVIVRHRSGTEKVKVMKAAANTDETIKVKVVETGESKILKMANCHFTRVE